MNAGPYQSDEYWRSRAVQLAMEIWEKDIAAPKADETLLGLAEDIMQFITNPPADSKDSKTVLSMTVLGGTGQAASFANLPSREPTSRDEHGIHVVGVGWLVTPHLGGPVGTAIAKSPPHAFSSVDQAKMTAASLKNMYRTVGQHELADRVLIKTRKVKETYGPWVERFEEDERA